MRVWQLRKEKFNQEITSLFRCKFAMDDDSGLYIWRLGINPPMHTVHSLDVNKGIKRWNRLCLPHTYWDIDFVRNIRHRYFAMVQVCFTRFFIRKRFPKLPESRNETVFFIIRTMKPYKLWKTNSVLFFFSINFAESNVSLLHKSTQL